MFKPPHRETVLKHDTDSDVTLDPRKRGFMAVIRWAQGRFPGATLSFTQISTKLE